MSNFGFYSEKSNITFESHLAGLQENTRGLLLDLRAFMKSLGDNVIEEPRPHRIAYAKSLNLRVLPMYNQGGLSDISIRRAE